MDGTLGSQTAWMLDGSGVRITSGNDLAEIVRAGAAAGWPVGVHAIGDRANREALDAFERTRDVWQAAGLRQRIEHAQCLSLEDLPRFAELGVAVSAQFTHAPSDEELAKRYWPDLLEGTYSFPLAARERRARANGSDAPIEELEPGRASSPQCSALAGRPAADGRAGAARDLRGSDLALPRRARARDAPPGQARRSHRARPRSLRDSVDERRKWQVVATMVGGRWVHNPPPWINQRLLHLHRRLINRPFPRKESEMEAGHDRSITCASTRSGCRRSSSVDHAHGPAAAIAYSIYTPSRTRGRRCRLGRPRAHRLRLRGDRHRPAREALPSAGGSTVRSRSLGPWAELPHGVPLHRLPAARRAFLYLEFGWAMHDVFNTSVGWHWSGQWVVWVLLMAAIVFMLTYRDVRHLDDRGRDPRTRSRSPSSQRSQSGSSSRRAAT